MTTDIGWVDLGVRPDADGFGSSLSRQVDPALDTVGRSAGSRFSTGFKRAAVVGIGAGLAAGAAAGVAAIRFASGALDEADEARKIGAQTAAVIKSTGSAADVSERQVGKLAGRLSNMAGIDDELIQNGANVLLTFTKIRNETGKGSNIFDRATKSALNMSAALGTDLKGSSLQVGKALNDPIKGVTALARAGVQFTSIQKAQITALVEGGTANAAVATGLVADTKMFNDLVKAQDGDVTKVVNTLTNKLTPAQKKTFDMYREGGHTLDAQKRILKELDTQFAGSAKSQATESDKLKVAYGNLQEEIGTALLPYMDDLAKFIRKEGIPAIQDLAGWVESDGVPAFKKVAKFAGNAAETAKDLIGFLKDLPDPAKYAGLLALIGGVGAVKLRGGKGALGVAGSALGLAKPIPVLVTNPGFGGSGGALGGKAGAAGIGTVIGSSFAIAAGPALVTYLTMDGLKRAGELPKSVADNRVSVGSPYGGVYGQMDFPINSEKAKELQDRLDNMFNGPIAKVDVFQGSLDLVGSTKARPELAVPGLKEANDGLADFISMQIEARRPVAPYISTTGIERAIDLLKTMNSEIGKNAQIERGTDGGVTYQHGGGASTGNGRVMAGMNVEHMEVQAHDYGDFTAQMQRRTQAAGLGGVSQAPTGGWR